VRGRAHARPPSRVLSRLFDRALLFPTLPRAGSPLASLGPHAPKARSKSSTPTRFAPWARPDRRSQAGALVSALLRSERTPARYSAHIFLILLATRVPG